MPDTLVTPPIRSPLMEKNDTQQTASRDWWLYFNQLSKQTNSNGRMVSYGATGARPDAASMPDGALYMGTDPGYTIYQNIGGAWHYVAGVQWGTLSPDQRPTNLGPNDAGFTFRGTDQAREYIWSGSMWVETGDIVENAGSPLPVRGVLNFTGAGVTATDDAVNLRTNITIPGGGGGTGAVSSVFGRTGAVAAASGDYSASLVTNAVDASASYANPSWISSLAWSKITGTPAPYVLPVATTTVLGGVKQGSGVSIAADGTLSATGTAPVTSVFGRTGAVVSATGDYTAAQVTNAVSTASTYADPAWITALSWSKITGAPSVSSYQTPWLSDINGAGFRLLNTGNVGVGNSLATLPSTDSAFQLVAGSVTGAQFGEITACANQTATGNAVGAYAFANYAITGTDKRIAFISSTLDGASNSGTIQFYTYSAGTLGERMRITSAGNVAIGATTAGYPLTVTASAAATTNALAVENRTSGVYGAGIVFRSTDSVSASMYSAGRIYGVFDNNVFSAARLTLQNATGVDTFQDVLTIKNGQVGIGTVSPGAQLDLSTDSARKLTTTAWATGSDVRIKQNIRDLEGGLPVIHRLRPVECEHNGLGGTVRGTRSVSLIAQEVQSILPGTVTSRRAKLHPDDAEETELLDFNPHECLFHLILAVQQLGAEVRRLKALIEKV